MSGVRAVLETVLSPLRHTQAVEASWVGEEESRVQAPARGLRLMHTTPVPPSWRGHSVYQVVIPAQRLPGSCSPSPGPCRSPARARPLGAGWVRGGAALGGLSLWWLCRCRVETKRVWGKHYLSGGPSQATSHPGTWTNPISSLQGLLTCKNGNFKKNPSSVFFHGMLTLR